MDRTCNHVTPRTRIYYMAKVKESADVIKAPESPESSRVIILGGPDPIRWVL